MQQLESTVSRQAIIREMEPEELVREYATVLGGRYSEQSARELRLIRSQYKQLTGTDLKL